MMAKTFPTEQDVVKLQILNLASKLCLSNPKQTKVLCQYVFSLGKYDQSYDIRDRVRFLRYLVFPTNDQSKLAKYAKKIFLASKPAPGMVPTNTMLNIESCVVPLTQRTLSCPGFHIL